MAKKSKHTSKPLCCLVHDVISPGIYMHEIDDKLEFSYISDKVQFLVLDMKFSIKTNIIKLFRIPDIRDSFR